MQVACLRAYARKWWIDHILIPSIDFQSRRMRSECDQYHHIVFEHQLSGISSDDEAQIKSFNSLADYILYAEHSVYIVQTLAANQLIFLYFIGSFSFSKTRWFYRHNACYALGKVQNETHVSDM